MDHSWSRVTRRKLLQMSALAAASACVPRRTKVQAAIPPHLLSATVKLHDSGKELLFDAGSGRDLGDFRGPEFTQACLYCRSPETPLSVIFRPDRDTDRLEVVFENGRCFGVDEGRAVNLGPYTVEIAVAQRVIERIEVPKHYWWSRWRYQSRPREQCTPVETLLQKRVLPPYGAIGHLQPPKRADYERYAIMQLAGLTPYMPSGGERDDIGPLTGPQAEYVVTGNPIALAATLAQAEAGGTIPWHVRDENTSAPISIEHYPMVHWFYRRGEGSPVIETAKTPIEIDHAHQPDLFFLPYMLTSDPYYLEGLQFQATYGLGQGNPNYREGSHGLVDRAQTRGYAWQLRTLLHAGAATPDDCPSWLLPKDYWRRLALRNAASFEECFVNNHREDVQLFRWAVTFGDIRLGGAQGIAPWEEEFLAFVLGWAVYSGMEEWRPSFEWKLKSTIDRTSGKSGWVRAACVPYKIVLKQSEQGRFAQSWAEAAAWTLEALKLAVDDPDRLLTAGEDFVYPSYSRAVLALAVALGEADARASFAWLDEELRGARAVIAYKWSVQPAPPD